MNNKVISIFVLVASLVSAMPAEAHRSGCHRWHSCASDSGSYTCGDTGHSNYCGSKPSEPAFIPSTTYTPFVPYAPFISPRVVEEPIKMFKHDDAELCIIYGRDAAQRLLNQFPELQSSYDANDDGIACNTIRR